MTRRHMSAWLRQRLGDKGSYFLKSMVLVVMITCVPSVLIAVSNYFIGINQVQKEVFRFQKTRIDQISGSIDKQIDQISMLISRWSADPMYGPDLEKLTFLERIADTQELMQSLAIVGSSNALIQEAQLYLTRQSAVVQNTGIQYLTPFEWESYQQRLRKNEGMFLAYDLPYANSSPVSIVFKLPWYTDAPYGAFVLPLAHKEIGSMVKDSGIDGKGTALLLRTTGEWVITPEGDQPLNDMLKASVLGRGQKSDAYPVKWNGETFLVSYGEIPKAGWIYVTAAPLSLVGKSVVQTSRLILASSLVGILLAFLLAFFASLRLYQPIGRLVQLLKPGTADGAESVRHELEFIERQWSLLTKESVSLQERLQQSYPSLREGFLLQLVQGHLYAWDEQGLKERMTQLGWEINNKVFGMLLIRLNGPNGPIGRFKENDEQLISFAAANIADELAKERLRETHVVNFQDRTVGVFCMLPNGLGYERIQKELQGVSQELTASLGRILGLKVVIIISRLTEQVGEVPELLEQARNAVRYRDLQEAYQIIDMEAFLPQPVPHAEYPFALEKELIHALRLGLQEESEAVFHEFMKQAERQSDREVMILQTVFQLLGAVRHMLIELGFTRHPLFVEGGHMEELMSLREPQDIEKWFKQQIIGPYITDYRRNQDFHSRQLIERAIEMLQSCYMEDLSLEECASRLSTSPYTLSRSFKQILGTNYVDYLLKVRMEKAKELLTGTVLKISEVAERVGYQHSYFNKLFKGEVGVTPTQFREQFRSKR